MARVNIVQDLVELRRLEESVENLKRRYGCTVRVPGSLRFKECPYCVPDITVDRPDKCPCAQILLQEYKMKVVLDRLAGKGVYIV